MSELIRYRYNTMADQTPGGAWKWRVIFERDHDYEEVPVTQLLVNVPSFSRDDDMPIVRRKYHRPATAYFASKTALAPSTPSGGQATHRSCAQIEPRPGLASDAASPPEGLIDGTLSFRCHGPSGVAVAAAHEFGYYLLHRKKYPQGFRCDEAAVDGRTRNEAEREANEFAATLLMPLDDFRRQIPVKNQPDFDQLSACATRYDVSLAAAILRWLRYTDRRAIIIVSRDGFMKWAWSSDAALKSGRYFKTSGVPVEVPSLSSVGRADFNEEVRSGINQPAGIWFDEPVKELSIRSQKYDLNYTLLHLSNDIQHAGVAEPRFEDTFDRFGISASER